MSLYRTPNSPFNTSRSVLCTVAFAAFSLAACDTFPCCACDESGNLTCVEALPNNEGCPGDSSMTIKECFVRPPDEYTRACTDLAGDIVYLVSSPDTCEPEDKMVCDFGNFGIGTKVCCSWELDDCSLVDPPDECLAVEVQVCSA